MAERRRDIIELTPSTRVVVFGMFFLHCAASSPPHSPFTVSVGMSLFVSLKWPLFIPLRLFLPHTPHTLFNTHIRYITHTPTHTHIHTHTYTRVSLDPHLTPHPLPLIPLPSLLTPQPSPSLLLSFSPSPSSSDRPPIVLQVHPRPPQPLRAPPWRCGGHPSPLRRVLGGENYTKRHTKRHTKSCTMKMHYKYMKLSYELY